MKTHFHRFLALWLAVFITFGCATLAEGSGAITFTDPAFAAKVRAAMGKADGDAVTAEEAAAVTQLDLSNESNDFRVANPALDIRSIEDVRYFPNLDNLTLSYNSFTDLSPLSALTSLTYLSLVGVRAQDFAPLAELTNLHYLTLQWIYAPAEGYYGLANLDVLSGMTALEAIDVGGCGVTDISALAGLTSLWSVFLDNNLITDIGPLSGLTNLRELKIANNPITDFSPVKDLYDRLEFKDFEPD